MPPHLCVREILPTVIPRKWRTRPLLEEVCRRFGHERLLLPEASAQSLFPDFDDAHVVVSTLPRGPWSTPLADQLALAKVARLLRPRTVLEVGSYRGYTALLIAENTPDDCRVYALDVDPTHGEAYRDSPLAARITRFVGSLDEFLAVATAPARFDFIYLDAEHTLESVRRDTRLALPMLAERGVLFWHDYQDSDWMSGRNRVPEALAAHLHGMPIVGLRDTALAVHREGWTREEVARAVAEDRENHGSHWTTTRLSG